MRKPAMYLKSRLVDANKKPRKAREYEPLKKDNEYFTESFCPDTEPDPALYTGTFLPVWTVATAIDSNGDQFAYSEIPVTFGGGWLMEFPAWGKAQLLVKGKSECSWWKDSLRTLDEY